MPLQKQFRGLSNWLGLYDFGEVKFELSPAMQAQFNASDFLTPPIMDTDTAQVTGVVGANVPFGTQVPQGEIWRVRWVSASMTINAAWANTRFGIVINHSASGGFYHVNEPSLSAAPNLIAVSQAQFGQEGLWLFPGDQFLVQIVQGGGAGNSVLTSAAQFQIIPQ